MMAHSYAHPNGLPCTGLRFFTIYGSRGWPEMALFLFAKAILAGALIKVLNQGRQKRSFTYIDDIVEEVIRTLDTVPGRDPNWSGDALDSSTNGVAPYRVYNIGNKSSVELLEYIRVLERNLGRRAMMDMLPLQAGDVRTPKPVRPRYQEHRGAALRRLFPKVFPGSPNGIETITND